MTKAIRKILIPLLAVTLVLTAAACNKEETLVTYNSENAAVSIQLPEGFTEHTSEETSNVDFYFQSDTNIVTFLSEQRSDVEWVYGDDDITLEEYASLVAELNGLTADVSTDSAGNVFFTYTNNVDGDDLFYYAVVKDDGDTLWLINFVCPSANREIDEPHFPQWAASIKFL